MSRFKKFLRVLSVLLVIGIAAVGVLRLDADAVFGRTALLSVAATVPDGFLGLGDGLKQGVGELVFSQLPRVDEIKQPSVSADTEAKIEVSTVSKTVVGNVIKQTLAPYNANTSHGSVYLNNQCGANVDIGELLNSPLPFEVEKSDEPQILIYHTHATEGYMENESLYYTDADEPRSTDNEKNVVKIGEVIAEKLREAGYGVIHDKTLHDHPGYTGSYSRSADTVKAAMEKYPSIVIAIDVHRDSILGDGGDRVAPVVSVNGKDAAQVMLVMGSQTGSVSDYPNWRQNLKLAVKLQNCFETAYPGFARSLLLRSSKYNQDLSNGSILIEIGSDANTLEQAVYSAELVGQSLVTLLKSQ